MPQKRPTPLDLLRRPLFLPLLGLILAILVWDLFQTPAFDKTLYGKEDSYQGILVDTPTLKDGKVKLTVALEPEGGQALLTALLPASGPPPNLKKGDRIAFRAKLKQPTSYRNPGSFDYARYLGRKGIGATGFVENISSIALISEWPLNPWQRFEKKIKTRIKGILEQSAKPQTQGVLIALLWGEESGLDAQTEDLFRRQGLSHLLVISGLHFTLMAWLLFRTFMLALRPFPRIFLHIPAQKLAALGSLALFSAYYAFCESSPSVLRAYIAVTCYLIAFLFNRSKDVFNILFLASCLILLITPADLFNPSFQFSFIAVLSILLVFPLLKNKLNPQRELAGLKAIGSKIGDLFLVNLAIFIGLTPVVVTYFHELQGAGLIMNLWAVPLVEMVIVPTGLIALLAGMFSGPIASLLFQIPIRLTDLMLRFLEWMGSVLPEPKLIFPPHGWEIALYGLLVLFIVLAIPVRIKRGVIGCLLILFLADGLWTVSRWYHSDEFKITQLDVGQGDSLFIQLPGPRYLLVDGGGSPYFDLGKNVLIPFLLHERIPRLDAVVLTHSDADHYLGLKSVIERYPVKQVGWNGAVNDNPLFGEFLQAVRARGIPLQTLKAGQRIDWGGASLEVVWPTDILSEKDNNQSVVLRLKANGRTAFLTGDIESLVEWQLLQKSELTAVDYLKVPHHGSLTSSSEDFLRALAPKIASAGAGIGNRFGHPHPKILERFQRLGIPLYRTDRLGAVEINLGVENLGVKPFVTEGSLQVQHFP